MLAAGYDIYYADAAYATGYDSSHWRATLFFDAPHIRQLPHTAIFYCYAIRHLAIYYTLAATGGRQAALCLYILIHVSFRHLRPSRRQS